MKKVYNLSFLLICLFFISSLFAQTELNKNQFEGYVIKDGVKIEGIIEVKHSHLPWSFQEQIMFFDKSLLESSDKVKKKDKETYKPTDIEEYGIGEKRYVNVNYFNTNAPETKSTFNKALSAGKALANQNSFAEVYHDGPISLYRYYNSPPDFAVNSGEDIAKYDAYAEECKTSYDILIRRSGEKAKQFDKIMVKKFFSDCDFVVEKFEKKQYTKKPLKGIKSAINNSLLLGEPLAQAAMEMIRDYEANCIK